MTIKLTESRLRQIIREELSAMDSGPLSPETLAEAIKRDPWILFYPEIYKALSWALDDMQYTHPELIDTIVNMAMKAGFRHGEDASDEREAMKGRSMSQLAAGHPLLPGPRDVKAAAEIIRDDHVSMISALMGNKEALTIMTGIVHDAELWSDPKDPINMRQRYRNWYYHKLDKD